MQLEGQESERGPLGNHLRSGLLTKQLAVRVRDIAESAGALGFESFRASVLGDAKGVKRRRGNRPLLRLR